jgi:hypothetical protein
LLVVVKLNGAGELLDSSLRFLFIAVPFSAVTPAGCGQDGAGASPRLPRLRREECSGRGDDDRDGHANVRRCKAQRGCRRLLEDLRRGRRGCDRDKQGRVREHGEQGAPSRWPPERPPHASTPNRLVMRKSV